MLARIFSRNNRLGKLCIEHCCRCVIGVHHGEMLQKPWRRWFGQPTSSTHPHILNAGEVTPGITKEEYRKRRQLLMEYAIQAFQGPSQIRDHLIIIPSASRAFMSSMIMYPFRQDTDFLYFSGFLESDSVLLLTNNGSTSTDKVGLESILFVPKRTPENEIWEVQKSGAEGAVVVTGVDKAYSSSELENFIEQYCQKTSDFVIWCDQDKIMGKKSYEDIIKELVNKDKHLAPMSLRSLIHALRVIKSPAEVKLMGRSVEIASEAMVDVIKFSHPRVKESHLYAKMEYECRIRDAQFLAYIPVIAGGNRANTIHYTNNDEIVEDGELVLMDAGCEYNGYTSDLTRTWPVSGRFSPAQRELYDIVLRVQEECVKCSTIHSSLQDIYQVMLSLLGKELQNIRFIEKNLEESSLKQEVRKFCPHHVGHYLGMDVHDTPKASQHMKLQPGMIITIEPGIYITADNINVPEKYHGIGIRIEDNVLITDRDPIVLSSMLPKDPDEIEALMAAR